MEQDTGEFSFFDTETTGKEAEDRIIQVAYRCGDEDVNQLYKPNLPIKYTAMAVHHITQKMVDDKPPFKGNTVYNRMQDLVDRGVVFVAHNAKFDMKFMNAELGWVNRPLFPMDQALDTLAIARRRFPGSPASLDALCRRFGIDNTNRVLHGALLDSEILAEVYLELIGGRQPDFALWASWGKSAAT
mgnify:CR=1 FL=1